MGNSNLQYYVNRFFDMLEMHEDVVNKHNYKSFLRICVQNFLQNENRDNAFEVYKAFFDIYRIDFPGETNAFSDIILLLEEYENTAAYLIDNQRDHFVHAVNVFLTGLSIYAANSKYRSSFDKALLESPYKDYYKTKHEEFFYRWGIASLLHDIGYPIEIVGNQINRFLRIVSDADGVDVHTKAEIRYSNFDELNCIKGVDDLEAFSSDFVRAYPQLKTLDLSKPIDLLAFRIHESLGTDLLKTKNDLDSFTETMAGSGFIDHGFFSALILLKWYGSLVALKNFNPNYLYWPILDSAAAILLHNYFKNVIRKGEYAHAPMKTSENPIAFLLILCDEAQEWNRTARGINTKKKVLADSVNVSVGEDYLALIYQSETAMAQGFCEDKLETFYDLLDIRSVFEQGVNVDSVPLSSLKGFIENENMDRPLLGSVERLAVAIHMKYNEKALNDHPGEALAYPNFSDLPDDIKFSNIRQAAGIYKKLALISCTLEPVLGNAYELTEDEIEYLSEIEHEDWVNERISLGWTLGSKDVGKKTTPYLVPYAELSEEIKDYDRDAIRNIPELVGMIGLEIRKK